MSLGDNWATEADLARAREHFAAGIPGWVQPVAHGIVTTDDHGLKTVEVSGTFNHQLPPVVLASVIGRTAGTATFVVPVAQLAEAVALLTPAEASTHCDHPNLWAWRRIVGEGHEAVEAVFVDSLDDPISSDADQLLREALRT